MAYLPPNKQYTEGATTDPADGTAILARSRVTPPGLADGELAVPVMDSVGSLNVALVIPNGGGYISTSSGALNINVAAVDPAADLAKESGNLATIAGWNSGGSANVIEANSSAIFGSTSAINSAQTDGTQKTQIVDNFGTAVAVASNALRVDVKSIANTDIETNKGGLTNGVQRVVLADNVAVLNGKTTVTTAGTRVVLAASTACTSVTIKALSANTGSIYVGNSTVAAANGFELIAGDSVSLDISNLNTVNIDSSVNGEGVTYLGVV